MSQLNPAAAIMQQNKQAELGRREDRAASSQQMLATLLTLLQNGRITREQLDAQMKIAGERIAAEKEMHGSTIKSNESMQRELLAARKGEFEKSHQLANEQAVFQRVMLQQMALNKATEGMWEDNGDPITQAENRLKIRGDEVVRQQKQAAILNATAAKKTNLEKAEGLAKDLDATQQEVRELLPIGIGARDAGTNANKLIGGRPVTSALDLAEPLGASGVFGKSGAPQFTSALAAVDVVLKNPQSPDAKALRTINQVLNGNGTKDNPGMDARAVFQFVESLRQMEANLRNVGPLQAGSYPLEPGMVAQGQQADKLRDIISVLESQSPYKANLLRAKSSYSDAIQRYTTNLNEGQVVNSEEIWKDFDEVVNKGDPVKRREWAQNMAAVAPQFGGNPTVSYWEGLAGKAAAGLTAHMESPDVQGSIEDAKHTAFLSVDSEQIKLQQKLDAVADYNRASVKLSMLKNDPMLSTIPKDQAAAYIANLQKPLDEIGKRLVRLGVNMEDPPMPGDLAEIEKTITQKQAEASVKMQNAQREQYMKSQADALKAATQQRAMVPAGPVDPRVQQGMTATPLQQNPATDPAVDAGQWMNITQGRPTSTPGTPGVARPPQPLGVQAGFLPAADLELLKAPNPNGGY